MDFYNSTIFPNQNTFSPKQPFWLEFQQLKEYFNFIRKFKADWQNKKEQGKINQSDYFLIDKIWLEKWKEFVNYKEFLDLNINRDATDDDYKTFKKVCLREYKPENKLYPLDNSNIYKSNGEINSLAPFVIINKKCHEIFSKSRQDMDYNINEKRIPLKFLSDKIELIITAYMKIFYFNDEKISQEIIVMLLEGKSLENITTEIEKANIKDWLKKRKFDLTGPDELEIEEKGCKFKIINKKLKLAGFVKNSVKPETISGKTALVKYKITKELSDQLLTKIQENISNTYLMQRNKRHPNMLYDNIKQPETYQTFQNAQNQQQNNINNNNNYNQFNQQNFQFNNNNGNNNQFNNNGMNNNLMNAQNNPNYGNNINMQMFPQNNINNMPNININEQNNQMFVNNMDNMNQMNQGNQMNQNNQMNMVQSNQMNQNNQMNMIQSNQMNPMNINQNQSNQMNQIEQINLNNQMNQNNPMFMNVNQINQMNQMNQMNFVNNNNINSQNNINLNMLSCPNLEMNNQNISGNLSQSMNLNKKQNFFTMGISFPHNAGLDNVGQSCYMNATIECLSNVKSLTNELLGKYGSYDIDNQPLCAAYSSLLYELFHTKQKSIEPRLFKQIIGKLNPLFEGNNAADAKDLLFFIIETLHKELNKNTNISNYNEIDFLKQEENSKNEGLMLQEFLKEFEVNSTTVSNIFYGINRSIMKCNFCGVRKYSFQTFNLIIFPLKKVKEYKMRKLGCSYNLNLDLYDAFDCEKEEEKLEGDNMIYCNTCRKLQPGINKNDIYTMPKILIIILNRGKNNSDFNEEFKFDEYLDFTDKNITTNQNSLKRFYLCGIITHFGESGSSGHFIAYCRNNVNEQFLCYNDSFVTQTKVLDAMVSKVSERAEEKRTPYILLYHYLK